MLALFVQVESRDVSDASLFLETESFSVLDLESFELELNKEVKDLWGFVASSFRTVYVFGKGYREAMFGKLCMKGIESARLLGGEWWNEGGFCCVGGRLLARLYSSLIGIAVFSLCISWICMGEWAKGLKSWCY